MQLVCNFPSCQRVIQECDGQKKLDSCQTSSYFPGSIRSVHDYWLLEANKVLAFLMQPASVDGLF